jgi:RHS repeat-associated protein
VGCYNHDNDGNLTSLTVGSSCSSTTGPINDTWSYDSNERVAVSTLNGTASGWTTYNGNNQIQYGTNMPTTTPGDDDAYGLANNGEINWAWRDAGTTKDFGYNSDDELCWTVPTSESSNTCSTPPPSSVPVTTYGYNVNGERTSATTTAGGTAGTITAVGTINSASSTGLSTLNVNPLSAGDLIALFVEVGGAPTITGVTGGGATWQKVRNVNNGVDAELWIGTVNTVGYSTITVSYTASVASDWVELSSQEFTYGTGAATTWHIDKTGEADNNWGSSSTLAYPALTPSSTHELYLGGSFDESASGSGATSGVVYQHTWDLNQFVYDTNVSAVLAPTAPDSPAGGYFNVAGLISVTGTVPVTATTNYNWNSNGELCSVGPTAVMPTTATSAGCGSTPSGDVSYQYNGDGLRMTSSTSSSTTSTAWDTLGDIPLDIDDATTTSGSTTNVSYIYGDLLSGGTAPIEQITTTSSGTTAVFLALNQTGVQGVFSSTGSTLELSDYSLYGQQTVVSGSDVTPFGFEGAYTDATGLLYLINRYYDPATDEFLSIDPDVVTTDQPYVFTNDDPLNAEDPLGLFSCSSPSSKFCESLLSSNKNAKTAFDYFVVLGLTTKEAAGIVGNFEVESGVNPKDGVDPYGIGQWQGGRLSTGLDVFAKQVHGSVSSLTVQLDYAANELGLGDFSSKHAGNGNYSFVIPEISGLSPARAAAVFDARYEGGSNVTSRENFATVAYNLWGV